jgi:hypothetical protein
MGTIPTEKRIQFVCDAATGENDVDACASAVFSVHPRNLWVEMAG